MRAGSRILIVLALLALLASACARRDGLVVRAVFDDVTDLVERGAVKIADVPVGSVSSIDLTGDHRALVTMTISRDVELPSRVSARLRKTSVLGERFVELVPDRGSGGRFEPGATITDTRLVPDLEDVVGSGSELVAAVTADKIAAALEAGATGLDGRGATLDGLLDDLTAVVSSYDRNSADLVRLIDGLDAFLAEAGPRAELHGRAFEELARTSAVLRQEDERLLDTLADLRQLAITGTDIMTTHRRRIDDFFVRLNRIADELVERNEDIERLAFELNKHNVNTIRGVNSEHAQVILDFIVCGINDTPGDPVRACEDPPQGRPRPEPRGG